MRLTFLGAAQTAGEGDREAVEGAHCSSPADT